MDEPSTPVRKQLFVHSPPPLGVGAVSATPRQRQLGAAISAFLNSPAVTPPNAPGSWANPHLEPQPEPERPPPPPPSVRLDLSAGTNYAAAPAPLAGLAGAGVLLRLAADSLSADPAEIHAAPLAVTPSAVADAERSEVYLQLLRDARADHRKWYVEASERHAEGRGRAALQLRRQRELRSLGRCWSVLRVNVGTEELARQRALDGWGNRTRRRLVHASWRRWSRRAAQWHRVARAFELTVWRCWSRTARQTLRDWRRSIASARRDAVATHRGYLRRLRRWFEQWGLQVTRWLSIHDGIHRSGRLALLQLQCVSQRALRYERTRQETSVHAWRAWCRRRVVSRRLLARCARKRGRSTLAAAIGAWHVYAVQHCKHMALARRAVGSGRGLQNSLRLWHRAASERHRRTVRGEALVAQHLASSRRCVLLSALTRMKRYAIRQIRCRRMVNRLRREQTLACWAFWKTVTAGSRRRALLLARALRITRCSMLADSLASWRHFKHSRRRIAAYILRTQRQTVRRHLYTWFARAEHKMSERKYTRNPTTICFPRTSLIDCL